MSKVLVTESYLDDIADAIREKLGGSDTYKPGEMAAAIESIETGGITPTGTIPITQNGTVNVTQYASANVNVPNSYAAEDEGKVVSSGALVAQTSRTVTENGTYDTTENNEVVVNVSGGTVNLQSKTATQNGVVTPDAGYDGLSSVVVNVQSGGTETALIPVMTSDTLPSGVASASSVLNANFAAYKAFDDNQAQSTMQGGWLASASDYTPYLQYEFASTVTLNLLKIWTANNGASATRTVTVEGRKNGTWENCLANGQNTILTFTQGTYGASSKLHEIRLNGETYDAIRVSGNERFYLGPNQTACTFSEVQVYTVSGGGGDVVLLSKATWDGLSIAEKRAYGLVAIQEAVSGYLRGILVNGADFSYLPGSNSADIKCIAHWGNFNPNSLSWGEGDEPISMASACSQYQSEEAVYFNALSGQNSIGIDLENATSDFTIYAVVKGLSYASGDVIVLGSVGSWSNNRLIMLYRRSGNVWRTSIYGSDTDLIDTQNNYVIIAIRSSNMKASWFAYGATPRTDVSYTAHGTRFTFGSRDTVYSTDLAVKFIGYVAGADSNESINTNLANLASLFELS